LQSGYEGSKKFYCFQLHGCTTCTKELDVLFCFLYQHFSQIHYLHPLRWAARGGHLEVVKELFKNDEVNVNANHPLRSVAEMGHLQMVKELLTNDRIDVNAGHPLRWAAQMGHLELVKEFLTNG
jgi:hypothetical protein